MAREVKVKVDDDLLEKVEHCISKINTRETMNSESKKTALALKVISHLSQDSVLLKVEDIAHNEVDEVCDSYKQYDKKVVVRFLNSKGVERQTYISAHSSGRELALMLDIEMFKNNNKIKRLKQTVKDLAQCLVEADNAIFELGGHKEPNTESKFTWPFAKHAKIIAEVCHDVTLLKP